MATVIVGSNAIIPAPLVTIQNEPIVVGNQQRVGYTYTLTINGTLSSYKGSPQAGSLAGANWGGPNNAFWQSTGYPPDETNVTATLHQLYMIESKQASLEALFATDGQWLEFQSADGSAPLKGQFKNARITYEQDIWFTICKYTIVCECDVLYLNGQIYQGLPFSDLIQSASEAWDIQPAENIKTFAVSHTVSAVGKRTFNSLGSETQPPWQVARQFVNGQLVLGWNGTSAFSANAGASIFNQSALGSGVINFASLSPFNFTRTEQVDQIGGSYSVTESWIAAQGSGAEVYTVNLNKIPDEGYTTIVASIDGTIRGFSTNLFDYDTKLAAAQYQFAQNGGPTGLLSRVLTYAGTGFSLNVQPIQGNVNYSYQEGVLQYNYQFSNRYLQGDAYEEYVVTRKTTADSYLSTFEIQGTIKGLKYDADVDPLVPFRRAQIWWATVSGDSTLYNRILQSKYFPSASSTMGLQYDPISKSIEFNEALGLVTYAYAYNNRYNDGGFPADNAEEEYQITKHLSLDEGITTFVIQGNIKGLNISDYTPQSTKFQNALSYWNNYASGALLPRVTGYFNIALANPNPQITEIGYYPVAGTISYQMEYRNIGLPILPGVLSEHIIISQENYLQTVNVIGRIPIPGRGLGPIIQDMGTTTEKVRSISVEAVVPPVTSTSISAAIAAKPDYTTYIIGAKPAGAFTEQDSENWDYKMGRYSRQIRWVFE